MAGFINLTQPKDKDFNQICIPYTLTSASANMLLNFLFALFQTGRG